MFRRALLNFLFCLLGSAFYLPSASKACQEVVLISSNSHLEMIHRIEAALFTHVAHKPKLVYFVSDKLPPAADYPQQSCLTVTLGAHALTAALKAKLPFPILSVLIRKSTFLEIINEYRLPFSKVSAIYLDQPLSRQLALLQHLLAKEEKRSIGVLLGAQSLAEQEQLQRLARKANLALTSIYINQFENPVSVLDLLLDETDAVLAIPDSRIYHPKTVRGILLTSFRRHIPLIGYSQAFVNQGALAAVYATPKQIAQQTARAIIEQIKNPEKMLPSPAYAQDFTVTVNTQVARSLGIAIESEADLKYGIEKMEKSTIQVNT